MISFPGLIASSFLLMLGSLQSRAFLGFSLDGAGRTMLSRRRAGGLFHVGKPYWDGQALAAQIVNPTAGLFAGDEMELTVNLAEEAKVELTSPSASRFYAMADRQARIQQNFVVGKGAALEYHPNWVVPQQGASVEQDTRIEVDGRGELIFFDCLSPGRVRHGEKYRYQHYGTSFEIRYGGELRSKERMVLKPDQGGWPLIYPGWEVTFYGAVWFVSHRVEDGFKALTDLEKKLNKEGLRCGLTRQGPGVIVFRLLAARSLLMKNAFAEIRRTAAPLFPILQREQRIPQI